MLHRIPHVRSLIVGAAVARFARVFGLCVNSGLTLVDSLDLASRSSGRPMLMKDVKDIITGISRGDRMATGLLASDYFPSFAKRLLAAGEESAKLQHMCDVISRHYDREHPIR